MKTTKEGFLMNTLRRIPRHMVKALAAGAVLIAAALPLAVASTAGAAGTSITGATVTFTPHGATGAAFGQGLGSGTIDITAATLVHDGGNVTLTTSAPGMTFSSATEVSATELTANFATTSATVAGSYSLTVTDDGGTSTSANAFTVNAAPTVTSLATTGLVDSLPAPAATPIVITGTGFSAVGTAGPLTVTFTSTVNGTTLTSALVSNTATSITENVTPTNSVTGLPATPGTYTVTVTNSDGGSVTTGAIFTITGISLGNVSPSAVPVPTVTTSTAVTISGTGFQSGAAVTLSSCTGVTVATTPAVVVTGATSISATFTVTNTATGPCSVTVSNPAPGVGGNGASFLLAGAFGIGAASAVPATISATSATAAIVPGAAASSVTFTGTGFSQYSTATAYVGTSATVAAGVTLVNTGSNAGTSATFLLTVASGASAGPDSVSVNGSSKFASAFAVAGPAIASQSPADVPAGAPYGTVITLTGTGFTNTTTGVVTPAPGGTLNGVLTYVSATSMTLVVTVPANAADVTTATTTPTVTLTQTLAGGVTVASPAFKLTVAAAPTISGVTYSTTGTSDVGVGATAQKVVFHGSGFAAGATVGTFVNGSSAADANVTATVTSVTPTAISATIAIKAGDTNFADGYTITNTDGGFAKTTAVGFPLLIGAGPTITSVSPATATASATTAFTITGTGFSTGADVAPTSGGTCGLTTVVSSTSITVSCTLGAAGTSAVSLVVTNLDGGSATSAAVLAAAVAPVVTGPFSKGTSGHARVGKTETVLIKGGGFYGQPTIRSNAKGFVKGIVSADGGTLLAVRVTVKANGATGEHTLTIILANGKSCKVNYATTK